MSITKQNVTSVSNLQKDFFLCDPKMPWNVASCIASLPALAGKLQTHKGGVWVLVSATWRGN